jgi:hypothetical protein
LLEALRIVSKIDLKAIRKLTPRGTTSKLHKVTTEFIGKINSRDCIDNDTIENFESSYNRFHNEVGITIAATGRSTFITPTLNRQGGGGGSVVHDNTNRSGISNKLFGDNNRNVDEDGPEISTISKDSDGNRKLTISYKSEEAARSKLVELGFEELLNAKRGIGFTDCDSLAILLNKLLRLNNEKLKLGWSKFENQCKAAAVRHNGETSFPREKKQAIAVSLLLFID